MYHYEGASSRQKIMYTQRVVFVLYKCYVKEKVKPGMRSRVIYIHFYERGRYVAHNRDVEYSPMHY